MTNYINSEIIKIIDDRIHSERDRDILKRRLIDGLSHDELSNEFHLSSRQIKNIVYKKQEIIFKHL